MVKAKVFGTLHDSFQAEVTYTGEASFGPGVGGGGGAQAEYGAGK